MVLANIHTYTVHRAQSTNGEKNIWLFWFEMKRHFECNVCTRFFLCTLTGLCAIKRKYRATKKHKKCRGNFYFANKTFIGFWCSHANAKKMSLTLEIKWIQFFCVCTTRRLLQIKNCLPFVVRMCFCVCVSALEDRCWLPWKHLFFINFYPQFYCTWQRIDSHLKFTNSLSVWFFFIGFSFFSFSLPISQAQH